MSRRLKIAVRLHPGADGTAADTREQARHAERLGLDGIFVGDHLKPAGPYPESMVVLAAAAGVTERIQVGVGVMVLALRDPDDPLQAALTSATTERSRFLVDLLYTDQVGGQRTISRFGMLPSDDQWLVAAARHWYLDARPSPTGSRRRRPSMAADWSQTSRTVRTD